MTSGQHRVFFALWPDAEIATRLDDIGGLAHSVAGGRRMRRDTLHLTLAFIGAVDAAQVLELQRLAEATALAMAEQGARPAFDLILDQLACWRHNHIVWLGARRVPDELALLADNLTRRVRAAGYQLDVRPFAAHITLLRNAQCEANLPEIAPLIWHNQGFALMESHLDAGGARYRILSRHGG